jgi:glycosyltransferase 2 family protein
VFRILYFMIPFGIAISIMGTRELYLNVVRPWQERRKLNDSFKLKESFTATNNPNAVPQPQPVQRLRSQGKR